MDDQLISLTSLAFIDLLISPFIITEPVSVHSIQA